MTDAATITALWADVEKWDKQHKEAASDALYAKTREGDALHRLNAAQKSLDDAMDELRKKSHPSTRWRAGA